MISITDFFPHSCSVFLRSYVTPAALVLCSCRQVFWTFFHKKIDFTLCFNNFAYCAYYQEEDVKDGEAFEDVGEGLLQVNRLVVEDEHAGDISWRFKIYVLLPASQNFTYIIYNIITQHTKILYNIVSHSTIKQYYYQWYNNIYIG